MAAALAAIACCSVIACASDKRPQTSPLTSKTRLEVAQAAESAGERDLAISMYIAAADSAPRDVTVQLRVVDALTRLGKITEAKDILVQRLKEAPNQFELIRALGLVYLVSGRPAEAVAQLDQLLAKKHDDVGALVDKAVALDLLRRHAEAQSIYRQVLKATPNDPAVRNDLALSLMLEGKIKEAEEQLAAVPDLESSPQRLKVNLGLLYAATGDLEKSRQLLGDRVSEGDLAKLTQAINAPAAAHGDAH